MWASRLKIPPKLPKNFLMCREQLDQLLLRLQSVLSKSEYDVLMLYGNGLSYKEIAEKLSVTEKAVDNAKAKQEKGSRRSECRLSGESKFNICP